jgi:hypothetical protein
MLHDVTNYCMMLHDFTCYILLYGVDESIAFLSVTGCYMMLLHVTCCLYGKGTKLCDSKVLQRFCKGVTKVSQGCYKGVTKVLQRCYRGVNVPSRGVITTVSQDTC